MRLAEFLNRLDDSLDTNDLPISTLDVEVSILDRWDSPGYWIILSNVDTGEEIGKIPF